MVLRTLLVNILISTFALAPLAHGDTVAIPIDCNKVLNKIGLKFVDLEAREKIENLRQASAKKLISQEIENPNREEKSIEAKSIQSDFAKALGEIQEEQIAKAYTKEFQTLDQDAEALEKCGANQVCGMAQIKKTTLKLKRAADTVWNSWQAESRSKKLLRDQEYLRNQIDSVLNSFADGVVAQSLGQEELLQKVNATLDYEAKSPSPLLERMGDMYWSSIKIAAKRKNIRTRPEVKRDLVRGLSIALLNQVTAEFLTSMGSMSKIGHNFANDSWVFANTITMMNIQAEIGGHTTEFIDHPFDNYEDAMKAIPDFIHGKNGFSTDFKAKFSKLFNIAWLELPIVLMYRLPTEAMLHGMNWGHASEVLVATLYTLAGIYTYLGAKWAVVDKPLLLNAFPNYLNGMRNNFEQKLYIAAQSDGFARGMTLNEFSEDLDQNYNRYKRYYENIYSLSYRPEVAEAYRKLKMVTYKELAVRQANGLWDAMVIFFIVHGANAAYVATVSAAQNLVH